MITVSELKEVSHQSLEELTVLVRDLHTDERTVQKEDLKTMVETENIRLVVVKDDDKIIGVATLYIQQKLGGKNGIVEDVVVSGDYRGQGLGEKLMREVIEIARNEKLKSISLTSRPQRVAAHKLYQKVGFQIKETTVFKLPL